MDFLVYFAANERSGREVSSPRDHELEVFCNCKIAGKGSHMPDWFSRKAKPVQNVDAAVAQHGKAATSHIATVFAALGLTVDSPKGKGMEHYFIHDPKAREDIYIHGFVSGWAKAAQKHDKTIGGLSDSDYFGFVGTMLLKLFGAEHLKTAMHFNTRKASEPEYQNAVREGFAEGSAHLLNQKDPSHLLNYVLRRVEEGHYVPID